MFFVLVNYLHLLLLLQIMKKTNYKKYSEIKSLDNITYQDLLSTEEWRSRRSDIIKLHNGTC